ncbi:hypothetical protein R1flu_025582 [Riccia fluitans]|uniref:Thioredoxin superfamily protein n=1 Tax=Riccia fluitans TaxID=41844 RepID=A0ABD1XY57_9MARC
MTESAVFKAYGYICLDRQLLCPQLLRLQLLQVPRKWRSVVLSINEIYGWHLDLTSFGRGILLSFVELLHEGSPVVVAFTLRCPWTKRFDRVLEDAASEWHPHIKFVRVECPKYPGFCIARQRKDYPFIEIFHSPKQGETEGGTREGSITRYSVNVVPFNYDMSPYGFREFFKIHGLS